MTFSEQRRFLLALGQRMTLVLVSYKPSKIVFLAWGVIFVLYRWPLQGCQIPEVDFINVLRPAPIFRAMCQTFMPVLGEWYWRISELSHHGWISLTLKLSTIFYLGEHKTWEVRSKDYSRPCPHINWAEIGMLGSCSANPLVKFTTV